MEFDVFVEIPQGHRNKYELDKETGRIRLDRMLFTSTRYPADYGFIENTLGLDGDPLDALVLLDEPTFPGCVIMCRAIGMFRMTDEAGGDDKVICVPAARPAQGAPARHPPHARVRPARDPALLRGLQGPGARQVGRRRHLGRSRRRRSGDPRLLRAQQGLAKGLVWVARYVALLRAVNVGGHNKVPMADFRQLLESLGHTDVATYLQSGNAVFTSSKRNASALAKEIEAELAAQMGLDVRALVLSRSRLETVVKENPMVGLDDDPTHLHIAFFSASPDSAAVKALDGGAFAPDQFAVAGDVAYLYFPNGMGRSTLDPGKVFVKLGVWSTVRNWRTVNQLVELAAQ